MAVASLVTESPIEEMLLASLRERLHPTVELDTQYEMNVDGKGYRADFRMAAAGKAVVIECDGRKFHDFNRDRDRDLRMLNSGQVTDVLRFRGCDIVFALAECLDYVGRFMPFLFDADTQPHNLETKLLGSASMLHTASKPIYRCRVEIEEAVAGLKARRDWQTLTVMGRTSDHTAGIVQLKTPYWDWMFSGSKAWQIGDYINFLVGTGQFEEAMSWGKV